jgi:hypothetical protein
MAEWVRAKWSAGLFPAAALAWTSTASAQGPAELGHASFEVFPTSGVESHPQRSVRIIRNPRCTKSILPP